MKLLLLVACAALLACASALPITHQARALVEADAQNSNVCTNAGGRCLDITSNQCKSAGGFQVGKCPGNSNIRCCPAPGAAVTPSAAPVAGAQCTAAGGECLHSETNSCSGGAFRTGLCPGIAAIKCCVPHSAPTPSTPAVTPSTSGKPSFETLRNCYPQGEAEEVKARIGGAVNADWITNTCAIRMSQTLNCAGKLIPQMGGESIRGKNKWNFIFRVKQLGPFVKRLFGNGQTFRAPTGRGVPLSALAGKRGIIMFDTTGAWDDATGHFDLWDGKSMVENSHQGDATAARYFGLSVAITIWEF